MIGERGNEVGNSVHLPEWNFYLRFKEWLLRYRGIKHIF